MNGALRTIYADSLEDLLEAMLIDLDELNVALTLLNCNDLLTCNDIAILFKIRNAEWTEYGALANTPPSMIWSYAKLTPAKGHIQWLSETAVKNGGLYSNGNKTKFNALAIIPNGLADTSFIDASNNFEAIYPSQEQKMKLNINHCAAVQNWVKSYFDSDADIDEMLLTLGQPDVRDNVLLRHIAALLARLAGGEQSTKESYHLVAGPYNTEHAKDTTKNRIASSCDEYDLITRLNDFVNINAKGMPITCDGIRLAKSALSTSIHFPNGLHPLHVLKFTENREIVGAAACAYSTALLFINDELERTPTHLHKCLQLFGAMDNALDSATCGNHGTYLAKMLDGISAKASAASSLMVKAKSNAIAKIIRSRENSSTSASVLGQFDPINRRINNWSTLLSHEFGISARLLRATDEVCLSVKGKSLNKWLTDELGSIQWGEGHVRMQRMAGAIHDLNPTILSQMKPFLFHFVTRLTGNASAAERITEDMTNDQVEATTRSHKRDREDSQDSRQVKQKLDVSDNLLPDASPISPAHETTIMLPSWGDDTINLLQTDSDGRFNITTLPRAESSNTFIRLCTCIMHSPAITTYL